MFCFRVRRLLIPYMEGGLGAKKAEAVARHLDRCPRCSEEVAFIEKASGAIRDAKTPAQAPAADLWARIEREIAAPVRGPLRVRGLQLGGAVAAAAIILLAVVNVEKLEEPTSESRIPETSVQNQAPLSAEERLPGTAAKPGVRPKLPLAGSAARPETPEMKRKQATKEPRPEAAPELRFSSPRYSLGNAAERAKIARPNSEEFRAPRMFAGPVTPVQPVQEKAISPVLDVEGRERALRAGTAGDFGGMEDKDSTKGDVRATGMPGPSGPLAAPVPAVSGTRVEVLSPSVSGADQGPVAARKPSVSPAAVPGEAEAGRLVSSGVAQTRLEKASEKEKNLGSLLAAKGDKQGALDAWRRGLEANPELDNTAILSAAESAGMLGDLQSFYERAPENKRSAAHSLILAAIYEHRKDFRRSAELRGRLARQYPMNQNYWVTFGDASVKSGNNSDAKEAYSNAAQMNQSVRLQAIARKKLKDLK